MKFPRLSILVLLLACPPLLATPPRDAAWLAEEANKRWPEKDLETWVKAKPERAQRFQAMQAAVRSKNNQAASAEIAELLKEFFPTRKGGNAVFASEPGEAGKALRALEAGAAQEGHELILGMLFRKAGQLAMSTRDFPQARHTLWNARIFLGGGNQFNTVKGLLSSDPRLIPVSAEALQASLACCASLGRNAARELAAVTKETKAPNGDRSREGCYLALQIAEDRVSLLARVLGANVLDRSVPDAFAQATLELRGALLQHGFGADAFFQEGLMRLPSYEVADPVLQFAIFEQEAGRIQLLRGPVAADGYLEGAMAAPSATALVRYAIGAIRAIRFAQQRQDRQAVAAAQALTTPRPKLLEGVPPTYRDKATQLLARLDQDLAPLRGRPR